MSDSEHPPAPDAPVDPEELADAAENAEALFRSQGVRLSASDLDEAERFGEIAGTLVLAGVPVLKAWETANAWLDEHPQGLPDWVRAEPKRPATMPPPRMLALVPAPKPPEERKCLFCGQRKPFPEAFNRRGDSGPRTSSRKCNDCFRLHPGSAAKPLFRAAAPEPGPRMCAFCTKLKTYPEDFRHPRRRRVVSSRKCTECISKGAGRELEEALEMENDESGEADEPAEAVPPSTRRPQRERPAPAPLAELPSAAPKPTLAERRAAYRAAHPEPPPSSAPPPAAEAAPPEVMIPPQARVPEMVWAGPAPKGHVDDRHEPKPKEEPTMAGEATRDLVTDTLRAKGPLTHEELVKKTGLNPNTLVGVLQRLRAEGLVTKEGRGSPFVLAHGKSNGTSASAPKNRVPVKQEPESGAAVSIPAPPGPLDETPLVAALLKERQAIVQAVSDAGGKVARIDELLNDYKIAG